MIDIIFPSVCRHCGRDLPSNLSGVDFQSSRGTCYEAKCPYCFGSVVSKPIETKAKLDIDISAIIQIIILIAIFAVFFIESL